MTSQVDGPNLVRAAKTHQRSSCVITPDNTHMLGKVGKAGGRDLRRCAPDRPRAASSEAAGMLGDVPLGPGGCRFPPVRRVPSDVTAVAQTGQDFAHLIDRQPERHRYALLLSQPEYHPF